MQTITRSILCGVFSFLLLWLPGSPSEASPEATGESSARPERIERGNLVIEGIPEIPERIQDGLRRYQNTRSASFAGWLPAGGGILISTRFGETSQVHLVQEPGGARSQLTFFDEPVRGANPSPNPEMNGFVFRRDEGGSEFFQLFFQNLASGEVRRLTEGNAVNSNPIFAQSGDRIAFATTQRNGTDWDIHLMDLKSPGVSRPVLEEGGFWSPEAFSSDDGKLLVFRVVSVNESHPYILDLEGGELTPFEASEEPVVDEEVAYGDAVFSEDGRGLYFVSDQGREFLTLRYHDFTSGATRLLSEHILWDVGSLALSADGRYLAFTANEDGIDKLHVLETKNHREMALPELPKGQIFGLEWNSEGTKLGMALNTSQTPGDVYSLDIQSREVVRWTWSEVGGLATETFVEPMLVHYETFDQVDGAPRTIPSFYYRPRGEGPFPVLIKIHGGPEAQARPSFNTNTQYLLNELGIAVLVPNVRGSKGYGKSYLRLDNGYKREDSVKDIGALLDWIDAQPELNGDRVAVSGGSYGGYMVLAAMTHYNDRLRAGIDVVGISNFVTFLKNTQDYRRDRRRVEYGDERDPEMHAFLTRISPTTNATNITKPLFVIQGLNDPRVPASESEQMVEVIRKGKGEVWYLLARDEGHGFRKKSNRDYMAGATVLFLEQHLVGGP